jgi:hypothetical protein
MESMWKRCEDFDMEMTEEVIVLMNLMGPSHLSGSKDPGGLKDLSMDPFLRINFVKKL